MCCRKPDKCKGCHCYNKARHFKATRIIWCSLHKQQPEKWSSSRGLQSKKTQQKVVCPLHDLNPLLTLLGKSWGARRRGDKSVLPLLRFFTAATSAACSLSRSFSGEETRLAKQEQKKRRGRSKSNWKKDRKGATMTQERDSLCKRPMITTQDSPLQVQHV